MSFLEDLNPVQRDAVTSVDGPVMIVAGAGSGKTRVLTYRAAYLIHRGVPADAILALTFTNKAADEMKKRIGALVGEGSRTIWMGTFHSLFARILRKECGRIGYDRNFTIYDTEDSLTLIKGIMNSLGISQQQFSPQGIRSRISAAKNTMVAPKAYRETGLDPMTERTALVYDEYERRMKQSNAMDFDDLLLKPLELFSRHPDVLERYQYRFKYVLVDEYQDTNRVQYRLIRDLAKVHRNVCVVGDDAQSIYGFRGADIGNILDFERDYPDCKIFRLEQNYRSTKTILAAADSLIRHNVDRIPKTLWTGNIEGEPVVLTVLADDREEGYHVVERIEEESHRRKLDLKDFAVLYRTNAQSRSLEDALRRSGIPYVIVGGVAFYKRKEIKDVLAYMKVVANPRDDESLARIVNVPSRAIGDTTLKKIRSAAAKESLSLYDALASPHVQEDLPEKTLRSLKEFHALLRKYVGLKSQMSAGELTRALVDDIGILQRLKEENTPESLARRENVQELVSALTEFNDEHPGATLEDFLQEVSLVSDVDMADFGRNAVTLMTLHAAKGLEFPVVFITGLEEGLFPSALSLSDRKDVEEERRLFYVGITRAMRTLYLSWALTRYRFGEVAYSVQSRFLAEIDERCLVVERRTGGARHGTPDEGQHVARVPARKRTASVSREEYASDPMPKYEEESQETLPVRVGVRVVHDSFGAGKIVAMSGGGDDARAVVDFESVGRKSLMLKFARLRPA